MRMTRQFLASALFVAMVAVPSFALAQSYSPSDLGGKLTPFGAIKAGNADGSIPAWDGGITKPPAGYSVGMHHPDPFPSEVPKFEITAQNMAKYSDKLTAGQKAMLQQYPTFRLPVYETHRTAAAPQRIYDATIANAKTAKIIENGNGVSGAAEGIPFPIPTTGVEAIWNHLLRWRGESVVRTVGQANPTADGNYTMIKLQEDTLFRYSQEGVRDENVSLYFIQRVVAPARLAGEILLVHETINQIAEPRSAWTYNPGQRRVRRAPNVAYDNPGTAADGLRTSDQLDVFNGAPDRYDWTLVGRKEIYVPYNSYKLHSDKVSYDQIIKPKHINPDFLRYELHRVWVVEAKVKSDTSHIYPRRTFYLDEDSWQIVAVDNYDMRGNLWRYQESYGINYYEVPTYWSTLDTTYDLQSGRYTAIGFDNKEEMYKFGAPLSKSDFTPDQLRREGVR